MIISDSVREPRPAKIQAYKAVKDAAGLLKLDTRPSNILEFKAESETATPLLSALGWTM